MKEEDLKRLSGRERIPQGIIYKEEKAIAFAGELENWCKKNGNNEAVERIRDIIYQFTGKFSLRRY